MGYKECSATSKRTGEKCKARAMIGSNVCYHHGGKSLAGIASPTFKNGRYTKYLPQGLLEAYQDVHNDPELNSVRQDIHLLDTLLLANLKKLDTQESGEAWKLMRRAVDDLEKNFADEQYGKCILTMHAMRDVIDIKVAHYATEEEVRSKLEQRRKMVETEQKLLMQSERAITAEQAMVLVSALLDSVKRNVEDRDVLTAIQADFISIAARENSHRVIAG